MFKEYFKLILNILIKYVLVTISLTLFITFLYLLVKDTSNTMNFLEYLKQTHNFNINNIDNLLNEKFGNDKKLLNNIFYLFVFSSLITILGHIFLLKKKGISYLQYLKIKLLPVFFGLNKKIEKVTRNNNKIIKFVWDKIKIKKGKLVVYNPTGIDINNYLKIKEQLEHFLNLTIYKIDKEKNGKIVIYITDPFEKEVFTPQYFKKDYIYFGKGFKSGKIYINLKELTHYFIVGQSGSGKSVFQNLLINNFIFNIDKLDKLFLVDLKNGVEFTQYKKVNDKIEVIDNIQDLLELTRNLINIMESRYKLMIKKDIKNWDGKQIIVFIDEYSSIKDQGQLIDKKDFKELENNIRTLLSKSRASGIKFFISTQKGTSDSIDTTVRENLQTKILLRTVSKEGQRSVLGGREIIDELGVEPSTFTKGRYIFFGELLQDLVQSPFVPDDFYKYFLNKKEKKGEK